MDIETFKFLDVININSINTTKNAFMLNKFKYKNVMLNLDLGKAQEILRATLDIIDLEKCRLFH